MRFLHRSGSRATATFFVQTWRKKYFKSNEKNCYCRSPSNAILRYPFTDSPAQRRFGASVRIRSSFALNHQRFTRTLLVLHKKRGHSTNGSSHFRNGRKLLKPCTLSFAVISKLLWIKLFIESSQLTQSLVYKLSQLTGRLWSFRSLKQKDASTCFSKLISQLIFCKCWFFLLRQLTRGFNFLFGKDCAKAFSNY